MPIFNSNPYYDPFASPGIFGIGSAPGRVGFFNQSGYNPYMAPTPPPPRVRTPVLAQQPAPGWEGVEPAPALPGIERRMANGGPTFNTTTSQLNNADAGGTGGAGGAGGGAGGAAQGYGILPWLGVGLYGLNTLGNLYLGHEALNQGWEQFRFQREMANQNLAASIQAYNNARRDRLRGRSGAFSEEDIDRMMEEQGLKDTRKRK